MAGRTYDGVQLEIHDELLKSIGSKLYAHRTGMQLRQEDLAQRCGLTRTSLSNIEAGRQVPSLPAYVALCRALRIDPGPLLREPECSACADSPPPGFRCLTCGRAATDA